MKYCSKKTLAVLTALLSAVSIGFFSGCTREELDTPGGSNGSTIQTGGDFGEGMLVRFSFDASSLVTATRSLTPAQEEEINTVDIIVFTTETGNDGKYIGHTTATKGTGQLWQAVLTKTDASSTGTGNPHCYVFVLNASEEVEKALENVNGQTSKNEFINSLSFDTSKAWDTSSPRHLPMWTEKKEYIDYDNNTPWTLKTLRSVARIDIGLNLSEDPGATSGIASGLADFTLTRAIVYNIPQTSMIIPGSDNIAWSGQGSTEPGQATNPTIANGGLATPGFSSGIEYTPEPASGGNYIFRQIYTGEAANNDGSTPKQPSQRACIVIGGKYRQGAESFYRIDMVSQDDGTATTFHDILRNRRYRVNITGITGNGYSTAEEAFNSGPVNITYNIKSIEEGGEMNNIVHDGRYQLSVDNVSHSFYRQASASAISIYTDHPQGWTAVSAPESEGGPFDWIILPDANAAVKTDSADVASISVKEYSSKNIEDTREGFFYIKSGALTQRINITQSADELLNIEVTPATLIFRKTARKASITVTVQPSTATLTVSEENDMGKVDGYSPFSEAFRVYGDGKDTGSEDAASNTKTYTISFQPADRKASQGGTVSGILAGMVTIYIKGDTGRIEARTLTIQQLATDIALNRLDPAQVVPAEGSESFGIRLESPVSWWINAIHLNKNTTDQAEDISGKNDVNPFQSGEQTLNVRFKPNNSWQQRVFTFHAGSSSDEFVQDSGFEITQEAPEPFISLGRNTLRFTADKLSADDTLKLRIHTNAKVKGAFAQGYDENAWNLVNYSVSPSRSEFNSGVGKDTYTLQYTVNEEAGDKYVTFRPRTYEDRKTSSNLYGPKAAGSVKEVQYVFTTAAAGLSDDRQKSATLTIQRETPAFFDDHTAVAGNGNIDGAISPYGGPVTLSSWTNARWRATVGGAQSGVYGASDYSHQTKESAVTVPAVGEYGSTPGEKKSLQVNFYYNVPDGNNSGGTQVQGSALSQLKYYVTAPSVSWQDKDSYPNNIAYGGDGSHAVTLKFGENVYAPDKKISVKLRYQTESNGDIAGPVDITLDGKGNSTTLNTGVQDKWGNRNIIVMWKDPRNSQWTQVGNAVTQYGYQIPSSITFVPQELNRNGGNIQFTIGRESANNPGSGKLGPYLGTTGKITVVPYATYASATNRDYSAKEFSVMSQDIVLDNSKVSSYTINISINTKSLFNRRIAFRATANDTGNTKANITNSATNNFGNKIYQQGIGKVLTVGGKPIVAAPKAVNISDLYNHQTWYQIAGTSPGNMWKYLNCDQGGSWRKPANFSKDKGQNISGFLSNDGTSICERYKTDTSLDGSEKVKPLKWRLPTVAEMKAIIDDEGPGHFSNKTDINLNNGGFECHIKNDNIAFLTAEFVADFNSGGLKIMPLYVVHNNNRKNITDSGYYFDEQAYVFQSTDTHSDPDHNKVPQPIYGQYKVYIRCVADLAD